MRFQALHGQKSIDAPPGVFTLPALIIDAVLPGIFAIQHSVMRGRHVDEPPERLTTR